MGLARQKGEARPYCSVLYIIHTRARSILPLVKMRLLRAKRSNCCESLLLEGWRPQGLQQTQGRERARGIPCLGELII